MRSVNDFLKKASLPPGWTLKAASEGCPPEFPGTSDHPHLLYVTKCAGCRDSGHPDTCFFGLRGGLWVCIRSQTLPQLFTEMVALQFHDILEWSKFYPDDALHSWGATSYTKLYSLLSAPVDRFVRVLEEFVELKEKVGAERNAPKR